MRFAIPTVILLTILFSSAVAEVGDTKESGEVVITPHDGEVADPDRPPGGILGEIKAKGALSASG